MTRKLSPPEIVSRYFPDADESLIRTIIWGLTGYPHFWHIPRDGNTPYQCFCCSVRQAARKFRKGISIDRQLWESWEKPMAEVHIREVDELTQLIEQDDKKAEVEWWQTGRPQNTTKDQRLALLREERSRHEKELLECPT